MLVDIVFKCFCITVLIIHDKPRMAATRTTKQQGIRFRNLKAADGCPPNLDSMIDEDED